MSKALFIVDVQNDFIEGGSLAVAGGEKVALDLVEHLKTEDYDHIITSQDWHHDPGTHWSDTPDYVDTWPVHCAANTHGAAIREELAVELDTVEPDTRITILKGEYEAAYSGFEGRVDNAVPTNVTEHLKAKNITRLFVVGIATDHCVKATVLDALNAGFAVTVLTKFIAGVDPDRSATALTEMAEAGATIL